MNLFLLVSSFALLAWSTLREPTKVVSPALVHEVAAPDSGKIVYDTYCLGCHQADGRGVPGLNPTLAKTDWVLGDKTRLIGVVLRGLNEEIEINGETFDNTMPAHNFLTDRQIAEVLSYVRSHFGNQAEGIKPEEVSKARKALGQNH